jgi:hypothetical protein
MEMKHCIASYAERAVNGNCYLFHIEHGDETASIEVDYLGRVLQAQGPRNKRNAATRWGTRALRKWGGGFPSDVQSPELLPMGIEDLPF